MTTIDWLLDGDPAIRWQVLQDLLDAPAGAKQNPAIAAEIESRIRAKVSGGDVALPVEGIEEAE